MKISEVVIDNIVGIGNTPFNQEVDYRGLRVKMKPSIFLNLVPALQNPDITYHKSQLDVGIAAPFLYIEIPDQWFRNKFKKPATVLGHEGRHRMTAILEVEGDIPVETHLIFSNGIRNRDLNMDIVKHLNIGMVSENRKLISGPIFEVI